VILGSPDDAPMMIAPVRHPKLMICTRSTMCHTDNRNRVGTKLTVSVSCDRQTNLLIMSVFWTVDENGAMTGGVSVPPCLLEQMYDEDVRAYLDDQIGIEDTALYEETLSRWRHARQAIKEEEDQEWFAMIYDGLGDENDEDENVNNDPITLPRKRTDRGRGRRRRDHRSTTKEEIVAKALYDEAVLRWHQHQEEPERSDVNDPIKFSRKRKDRGRGDDVDEDQELPADVVTPKKRVRVDHATSVRKWRARSRDRMHKMDMMTIA